ncbi:MAG: CoA transferase [Marinibacterium sp.]|nr:CoA transferase [Marinibacterium sp.]
MTSPFPIQIARALGAEPPAPVTHVDSADLPSCYPVSALASASVGAAAGELGALIGARDVVVDDRLASLWFDMTLQPQGWALPSPWDAIAGVHRASDGWIRLHTNAPHHRDAALRVLGCGPDKPAVAAAVSDWARGDLETAIVDAGGAAAAMHGVADWSAHPQGRAVASEPLIAWADHGTGAPPVALDQVRVLDLTRVLAGPVATRFLAGFGARVLRIDPPGWAEPGVEPEVTIGKRRAGLDLTRQSDRATFDALLAQADVLVHGYRPGALAGLGYDAQSLRARAPQLIDISLSAYGHSGPWAGRRGFDSLVQMSCGIAAEGMRRSGADVPLPLPVQALDHATGYLMAAAALRALRQRNAGGRIRSARLSLARTAALLMSGGARDLRGTAIPPEGVRTLPEDTGWGPARRPHFPVAVDGRGPRWRHPAGPLRVDPAAW